MADKHLTFQQYRAIDLTIWLVIGCVFEYVVTIAATQWFPEYVYYSVTLSFAFMAIVLMRWNYHAIWVALACGLSHCIALGATWQMYLTVCVGNVFCLFVLLLHKLLGKNKICKSWFLCAVYVLTVFAVTYAGRILVGIVVGVNITELLKAVMYDMFSAIFAVVLISISRKQDGLFEDQQLYVERVNKQEKEQMNG